MRQPTVGDIVHYEPQAGWTGPKGPIAVMVTAIHANGVNLSSFLPGVPPGYLSEGSHAGAPAAILPFAANPTPGHWNWPPLTPRREFNEDRWRQEYEGTWPAPDGPPSVDPTTGKAMPS